MKRNIAIIFGVIGSLLVLCYNVIIAVSIVTYSSFAIDVQSVIMVWLIIYIPFLLSLCFFISDSKQNHSRNIHLLFAILLEFHILITILLLFFKATPYFGSMGLLEYTMHYTNLIPFKTITGYLFHPSSLKYAVISIAGNVALFIPLAFFALALFKKIRNKKVFFITFIGIDIFIETLQLLLQRGSFDVDDIMLNVFGVLIGFVIWKYIQRFSFAKNLYVKPE